MNASSIFAFASYKTYLSERLKRHAKRGEISRAAEAMGCQVSYLSRVIRAELHLTPDQAYRLARHLRLSSEEGRFFRTLVELERASDPAYREHLRLELQELRRQQEDLTHRTRRPPPRESIDPLYFSSWQWSAIHFLSSAPGYQTPKALAKRLRLSSQEVLAHLAQLERWGMVKRNGLRWEYAGGEFHLPRNSPLVYMHHQNWRARAVLDAQLNNESIHFTSVQTLSHKDLPRLKALFLSFIDECNAILGPSTPEEGVAITCDFFRI